MAEQESLTVHELVAQVYQKVKEKLKGQICTFENRVLTEIANDSDWHRSRVGYMGYREIYLVETEGKTWIVGRGEACGQYPADPYDSDIFVLALSKDRGKTKIEDSISRETYFSSSAFFALKDGLLGANSDSEIAQRVFLALKDELKDYFIKPTKYRDDVIGLDLRPIASSTARYKPELAEVLASRIAQFVTES